MIVCKNTTIKVFNPGKGKRLTMLNSGPFDVIVEYPVAQGSDSTRISEGRLVNIVDSKACSSLTGEVLAPRFVCSSPYTKEDGSGTYVKVKLVGVVDINLPSTSEINPGDFVLAGAECDQMFCVDPIKLTAEDDLHRLCGLVLSKGTRAFDGGAAATKVSVLSLYCDLFQIADSQIPSLRGSKKMAASRDGSSSPGPPSSATAHPEVPSMMAPLSSVLPGAAQVISTPVPASMVILPPVLPPTLPPIPSAGSSLEYSPSYSLEVLSLLRFLDTKSVPVWLVVLWIAKLKAHSDNRSIQQYANVALEELSVNGIIQYIPEHQAFSVVAFPPPLRPFGERPDEPEDYTAHLQLLIDVVREKLDGFDYHQPATWRWVRDVIPHILRLITLPIKLTSPGDFATVLYHIAEYLRQVTQDYDQAHLIHRTAFEIRVAQYGDMNHLSAVSLAALGKIRLAREQLQLAREIFERVFAVEEGLAGDKGRLRVAKCLLDLGSTALLQGLHADAVTFLEKSFTIRKSVIGGDTEECVEVVLELANVHLVQGGVERAKQLLDHCQASLRKLGLEDSHHLGAQLYYQLGRYYISVKNPREAFKFVEKSRDLRIRLYGTEDHPEVITCLEALATLSLDQNNPPLAQASGKAALAIGERLFDQQQQSCLARVLYVMARLYAKNYLFSIARDHLKRALDILRRLYQTEENPFSVIVLREYGFAMFNEGNYKQGEESFKKVIELNTRMAATESYPGVASDLYDLGRCMALHGDLTEAVMVLRRGLEVQQLDDQSLSKMLQELGWIFISKESEEEARAWFMKCLLSDTLSRAKDEALMATMFHELGRTYYEEGKFPEAIAHFEQSLEMSKRFHLTENHPNFATTLGCLAQVFFDQGKADIGRQHLQKAFLTCKRTLGDAHPTTAFFQAKLQQLGGEIHELVVIE